MEGVGGRRAGQEPEEEEEGGQLPRVLCARNNTSSWPGMNEGGVVNGVSWRGEMAQLLYLYIYIYI